MITIRWIAKKTGKIVTYSIDETYVIVLLLLPPFIYLYQKKHNAIKNSPGYETTLDYSIRHLIKRIKSDGIITTSKKASKNVTQFCKTKVIKTKDGILCIYRRTKDISKNISQKSISLVKSRFKKSRARSQKKKKETEITRNIRGGNIAFIGTQSISLNNSASLVINQNIPKILLTLILTNPIIRSFLFIHLQVFIFSLLKKSVPRILIFTFNSLSVCLPYNLQSFLYIASLGLNGSLVISTLYSKNSNQPRNFLVQTIKLSISLCASKTLHSELPCLNIIQKPQSDQIINYLTEPYIDIPRLKNDPIFLLRDLNKDKFLRHDFSQPKYLEIKTLEGRQFISLHQTFGGSKVLHRTIEPYININIEDLSLITQQNSTLVRIKGEMFH